MGLSMGRKSLFGGGGTLGHIKGGAKFADSISTSHNQANDSTLKVRRSSRLRKITVVYESEAAKMDNLSLKHHQEISTHTCVSSTKQGKIERPYNQMHSSPQFKDVLDAVDTDDESTADITLRDMFTRCTTKKRKAFKFNAQSNADMQEPNMASMIPKEVELEETLFSLKEKKRKSSSTGEKLNKISKSAFYSSPVDNMPLKTFSLVSVAAEAGLGEATFKGTNFDELLANSDVGLRHKIENINVKMKAFTEQSSLSLHSPKSDFDFKKEIIETCLNKSNSDNCTINSSSAFIIKCDSDNICLGEGPDNSIERENWGQPGCVTSNKMNSFARDIIEQSSHEFSSAPSLDTQETSSCDAVNANNQLLVVFTSKSESTAPSVGSIEKLKHKTHEKDDQHELQFEELLSFDKESIHFFATENSSKSIEYDREKVTCSLENDRWLDENKKHNLSNEPCNKIIIPLVSEFIASTSYDDIDGSIVDADVSLRTENHLSFVDRMKHSNMDRNSSLGAINRPKILDVGEDGEYNMAYGDFDEVRESMQSASTSAANNSQMDCSFLPRKTVALVDSCSITEAGSSYVSTSGEVGKQSSLNNGDSDYNLTTYFLLNADGWAPQPDESLASSQMHLLNRRLESQPCCVNYADLTYPEPSEGIICHFPASQLHEIEAISQGKLNDGLSKTASMDTVTDLPTSSSFDSSTKACVERQITNISTADIQTDNMFVENQCIKEEHCTKKLLSNRKEISPISQEKLIRALNTGGLDDVVKLSNSVNMLCFDKRATKKPLSSFIDNGDTFLGPEHMIKKPKTINQSLPEVTKGILKSTYGSCGNPCFLENSSIHAQSHDAILFSQRQMQDTENIATKLLHGLNSLKSIVEETLFSGPYSFPSSFNFDEIRLATKHASKLEVTTKKWLAMMAKDCNRFCKLMRLAENKFVSPVSDLHKGRRKITFADEAGGTLCHVKVYEQQPVAFIVPKS